jgi:hypothetical protein
LIARWRLLEVRKKVGGKAKEPNRRRHESHDCCRVLPCFEGHRRFVWRREAAHAGRKGLQVLSEFWIRNDRVVVIPSSLLPHPLVGPHASHSPSALTCSSRRSDNEAQPPPRTWPLSTERWSPGNTSVRNGCFAMSFTIPSHESRRITSASAAQPWSSASLALPIVHSSLRSSANTVRRCSFDSSRKTDPSPSTPLRFLRTSECRPNIEIGCEGGPSASHANLVSLHLVVEPPPGRRQVPPQQKRLLHSLRCAAFQALFARRCAAAPCMGDMRNGNSLRPLRVAAPTDHTSCIHFVPRLVISTMRTQLCSCGENEGGAEHPPQVAVFSCWRLPSSSRPRC